MVSINLFVRNLGRNGTLNFPPYKVYFKRLFPHFGRHSLEEIFKQFNRLIFLLGKENNDFSLLKSFLFIFISSTISACFFCYLHIFIGCECL
jgi:hypothetical protein